VPSKEVVPCEEVVRSHEEENTASGPGPGPGSGPDSAQASASASASAGAKYRKWNRGEEARFTTDSTANIFSSPFYKGRRPSQKHWAKPRFVEDTDGWVSIRQGNDAEGEEVQSEVIYEKRPVPVEQPVTPDGETVIFPPEEEAVTASMWAERIKNTLEKAEATRGKPKEADDFKESLNRLSFFRRSIV
jgi:hypothetical protein